jgi:hypothetical protein
VTSLRMSGRLPIFLSREQQKELQDHLVEHAVRGPQRRTLLDYLFKQWLDPAPPQHISVKDILKECSAFTDDRSVRSSMTRLKLDLRQFFDGKGNQYPFRLTIEHGYQPRFTHNGLELHGAVSTFWRPYVGHSVRIVYPEPIFFRDAKDAYIRMPGISSAEALDRMSYLNYAQPLKENCSFVPSGIVEGMLFLLEMFQKLGIRFRSSAVLSDVLPDGDEPVIVLGTPNTARLVTTLEASTEARSTDEGVSVSASSKHHRLRFVDTPKREDLTGTKHALLTRRTLGKRLVTILSAAHGRTVQALSQFLTQEDSLALFATKFGIKDELPTQLQAVFEVKMVETDGEPHIDSIWPKHILQGGP